MKVALITTTNTTLTTTTNILHLMTTTTRTIKKFPTMAKKILRKMTSFQRVRADPANGNEGTRCRHRPIGAKITKQIVTIEK